MARPAYVMTGAQFYRARPEPTGYWRGIVRGIFVSIVEQHPQHDSLAIVEHVDARREHHAKRYEEQGDLRWFNQAWTRERTLLLGDLGDIPKSADEWAAIEVAIDMQENIVDAPAEEHDEIRARIRAFLDEQAPHREARVCPTCSAVRGKPCKDIAPSTEAYTFLSFRYLRRTTETTDRLIPHAARCQP